MQEDVKKSHRVYEMMMSEIDRSMVTEIIITCIFTELPEDCRGRWESFVGETLRETNRRNTVDLVRRSFMNNIEKDI